MVTMETHILQERVGLYSLLRALYTYPMTTHLLLAVSGLNLPDTSPLADPLAQMRRRIQEVTGGNGREQTFLPRLVERLNVEMTGLLEGPGAPAAPPYASYYLNNGRLMGPEAVAVRRFYAQWQAIPDLGISIPPDHIALEFGFLAYLAQRAAEAESEDERQAALAASYEFLTRHVRPWLPRFLQALEGAAKDEFFRALAAFTRVAVSEDIRFLTEGLPVAKSS